MLILILLHALAALTALALGRRLGPRVFLVAALAPLASVAFLAGRAPGVLDGRPLGEALRWAPSLGLVAAVRLDGFSLLVGALVAGIGVLVMVYASAYFHRGPAVGRAAALLVAFAGAMLGVVLADDLLLLYVFWELTSITSYLLIGIEDEKGSARAAALHALLVTGGGGLAMLGGFVLLGQEAGTYRLSEILAAPPSGGLVAPALALILVGAFTKSAQFPFHGWLPGAMSAPTPISAYLHSATMVKAGVYLVARLAPAFAAGVAFWRPTVVLVGLTTMAVGGWRALREHDLKLLLAYGTVSQLGFMTTLFGVGLPEWTFAGAAILLTHALFKAALFMVVGVVDHQAGTRDLRRLGVLWRALPATAAVAVVAVASMAGLPLLATFPAKELAFEAALHGGLGNLDAVLVVGLVGGSALTAAYAFRFVWGAFVGERGAAPTKAQPPAPSLLGPAMVLAALSIALGVAPVLADEVVAPAAQALDVDARGLHLALWHGITTALVASAVAVGLGLVLFLRRHAVVRLQRRMQVLPPASAVYARAIERLLHGADVVTGFVQNGSLPIYLGVILLTAVTLPGAHLVTGASLPQHWVAAETPMQALVTVLIVGAAVGTAVAARRFVAVLFLGGVGYGVAVLFVIQGAPDLALTQFLVETLSLVIFVLVLRHLPERFGGSPSPRSNVLRLAVAGVVGVFVTAFALVAAAARTGESVSEEFLARSLPEAGGRNVVNVILVDFRAIDTLGEITVLGVAALGVAALVRTKVDDDT